MLLQDDDTLLQNVSSGDTENGNLYTAEQPDPELEPSEPIDAMEFECVSPLILFDLYLRTVNSIHFISFQLLQEDYKFPVYDVDANGHTTDEIGAASASSNQSIHSIEEVPNQIGNIWSPKTTHTCNQCSKTYRNAVALETHKKRTHGGRVHACTECDKRFTRGFCLKRHMRTHTGIRPHTCNECNMSFSDLSNLNAHKKVVHQGIRRYKCHICSKRFVRHSVFQTHLNVQHDTPLHACDQCSRTYVCASHLEIHKKCIHQGIRPYDCAACDKSILQDSYIEDHLRLHESEIPCTCGQCFRLYP